MPLPTGGPNIPWPPKEWGDIVRMWAEHDAWYSGDTRRLAGVYGAAEFALNQQARVPWWRFWNRTSQARYVLQQRTQLHVPLAGDIANTSALLLFGEKPLISIAEAHEKGEQSEEEAGPPPVPGGPPPKPKMITKAQPGSVEAEDRLQHITQEMDLLARLYEGAETCSAIGAVILKPMWDLTVCDYPFINVVQADNSLPEFKYGRLTAVTLWRKLPGGTNKQVWRHVERHELAPDGMGIVFHGLFVSTNENTLGEQQPLTAHDATAGLSPVVALPFPGLGVEYIPNMRPNRRFRGWYIGQSDFAGIEGIMDQLDEVWASWMRDIRLAKARLIVPPEFLTQPQGPAQDQMSARFDIDQEVFSALNMDPESLKAGQGLTAHQFNIRVEEHERTSNALVERAVTAAGYSPQTFGLHIEGRADSGTALRIRENKTFLTQQRKSGWWETGVASALEKCLWIDKLLFTPGLVPFRPHVKLSDAVAPDALGTATTVEMLERAKAISTYMKVKMVHPDWTEDEVQAEVQRIEDNQGLSVPNPETLGIIPPTPPPGPQGVEEAVEGSEEVA
jgi:hypothetical protein